MKKMKVFFAAAALMLVTAGVFAGSSRFSDLYDLAYFNGTSYTYISGNMTPAGPLNTSGGTQATITDGTTTWGLYYYDVSNPNQHAVELFF